MILSFHTGACVCVCLNGCVHVCVRACMCVCVHVQACAWTCASVLGSSYWHKDVNLGLTETVTKSICFNTD